MQIKRIIVLFTVLALLMTLTTSAYASSRLQSATPGIVGVWHTSIKIEALPEAFQGLWSFSGDGNFLDTNSYHEANPGVWIGSGNTYVLTFWGFLFDEKGQANGKGRVTLLIHMDDADHFTADGETDSFDLDGNVVKGQFDGPVHLTGKRMQIELPQLKTAP